MTSPAQPRKPNRLVNETSPYLLQHAHNPVDWWPWSDEAFEEARRRNVPVFLSIGYSTCYWCHVMERESFENDEIAAQLNQTFVPIKVDREERPDLDEVYMAATVMMTSRGGWPMSVFLEPAQRRPFWCGTYFPPTPARGMPSFPQVLASLSKAWHEQRDAVEQQSEEVASAIREQLAAQRPAAQLGQEQVALAVQALLKIFDRTNGGFGAAPKFPQPVFLEFLLDARERAADDSTADAIDQALRRTLDKMACGGIHDHVGGGFHRYAVDAHWLVPHFEKMLYDNAQLARVYARAARRFGDPFYEQVARNTLAYVQREMTHKDGGFFSAQDAEVDGREGLNYLWTPQEIRAALTDEPGDADFAIHVYGLDQGPNFKDPHHPDEPARNVLRLEDRPERLAPRFNIALETFNERLASINQRLYAARQTRKQPRLDDKVLAAWNGLMIGAFATAARELEDPSLLAPAKKAASFVLLYNLTDMNGPRGERRLLRSWREGKAGTPAFLEDHSFLIHGLIELGRAGSKDHEFLVPVLLRFAQAAFFDQSGAIYDTQHNATDLFVRARSTHDGATPAGVSVMLHDLLDFAELSGNTAHQGQALNSLIAISSAIAENPVGTINSTRALLRLLIADEGGGAAARLRAVPASPPPQRSAADLLPVEIYASVDRVSVSEDKPAELTLIIKIQSGYHVPAAALGGSQAAMALIPFRVGIVNGTGVAAYANYPKGERYGDPPISAYQGQFELPIALERKADWSGRPLLSVTYQACTDTECLAPVTVELDIAIDAA